MTRNAAIARLLLLPIAMGIIACGGHPDRPSDPTIQRYLSDAQASYSGERALEMVAAMESTWRVPGNEGFNQSIAWVVDVLEEAGYQSEEAALTNHPLTYRVESRPMDRPTWEPVGGSLEMVGSNGGTLLEFSTNRNMIAIYSHPTPTEGIETDLVYVGDGSPEAFEGLDVAGKIVFGETSVRRLFSEAVQQRGAVGVLSYSMPAYTRPDVHQQSIQFSRIPLDTSARSWGVRLSFAAKERLKGALEAASVRVRVTLETKMYEAEELTLVADVHGTTLPDERLVLSAHVQEPGANDNASGVAVQAELARVLGDMVSNGAVFPQRSITMLWGDEIRSTRRYIQEDSVRAAGIRWGISLDMVGEDTDKTGGAFLVEKMPDPSAVWTRGDDRHTEWGGRPLSVGDLTPHYLNDFVLNRCLDQAASTGWIVKTNPYEGGSDHVPFLRANIPGILLWHFTDEFYHTDGDRLDKVSVETMTNVGISTLVSALTLSSADGETARFLIAEVESAALARLATEFELSRESVAAREDAEEQRQIVSTWVEWYRGALLAAADIEVGGASPETRAAIDGAVARVVTAGEDYVARLSAWE